MDGLSTRPSAMLIVPACAFHTLCQGLPLRRVGGDSTTPCLPSAALLAAARAEAGRRRAAAVEVSTSGAGNWRSTENVGRADFGRADFVFGSAFRFPFDFFAFGGGGLRFSSIAGCDRSPVRMWENACVPLPALSMAAAHASPSVTFFSSSSIPAFAFFFVLRHRSGLRLRGKTSQYGASNSSRARAAIGRRFSARRRSWRSNRLRRMSALRFCSKMDSAPVTGVAIITQMTRFGTRFGTRFRSAMPSTRSRTFLVLPFQSVKR